jgi:hypothetical protein
LYQNALDSQAQAEAERTQAGQAYGAFTPYNPQDVEYKAPPKPEQSSLENPTRTVVDALGALFTRHSAAPYLIKGVTDRFAQAKADYEKAQQDAADAYARDEQREQNKVTRSDREEALLAKRYEVADTNATHAADTVVRAQAAQAKQAQTAVAQQIAERHEKAYEQNIANRYATSEEALKENTKYRAEQIGLKRQDLVLQAQKAQWHNYTSLLERGMQDDTARQLATQRNNLQLTLQKLKENFGDYEQNKRLDATKAMTALKEQIAAYDHVIQVGSSALANPAAAEAAAQLLLKGPKGQASPYDTLMANMRQLGVSVSTDKDFSDMIEQAQQQQASAMSGYTQQIEAGTFYPGYGDPTDSSTGGQPPVVNNINVGQGQPITPPGGAPGGPFGLQGQQQPPSMGGLQAPPDVAYTISGAAQYWNVPPQILTNMLGVESGFRTYDDSGKLLTSKKGAQGMAQFMPDTAKQYGVDPTKPEQSIYGAAHYLNDLLARYHGDIVLAVAAYNAGPKAVDAIGGRAGLNKLPPDTQAYIMKVFGQDPDNQQTAIRTPPGGFTSPGNQAPVRTNVATANPAGKPPAATAQPNTPNDKTKGNPVGSQPWQQPPKMKPEAIATFAQGAVHNYSTNFAGQNPDGPTGAWAQIAQALRVGKQDEASIHAIGEQALPQMRQAYQQYLAQQKAAQDEANKYTYERGARVLKSQVPQTPDMASTGPVGPYQRGAQVMPTPPAPQAPVAQQAPQAPQADNQQYAYMRGARRALPPQVAQSGSQGMGSAVQFARSLLLHNPPNIKLPGPPNVKLPGPPDLTPIVQRVAAQYKVTLETAQKIVQAALQPGRPAPYMGTAYGSANRGWTDVPAQGVGIQPRQ